MKKKLTLCALLLVGTVYGQAPKISYATPQSYPVGKAITPLAPTNTGGAVASGTTVSLLAGKTPGQDGTGANANFNIPQGVAVDAGGNVYVADTDNHKIRKITPSGVVTTLAGSGKQGAADGIGTAASFNAPSSIAVDVAGNLYVADRDNHKIRKITTAGVVTTLAGSGTQGATDGIGTAASFAIPNGVAVDADSNVYVADWSNHKIRKITAAGVVTTLAGSGSIGDRDGTGIDASFNAPQGVTVDATGNVYVADSYNNKIRKITAAGVVTTFVLRYYSPDNTSPDMYYPRSVAVDAAGNVYVADMYHNRIIKITPEWLVTTLAGGSGISGDTNGTGKAARFNNPAGIAIDAAGNVYVADSYNTIIRKIDTAGVVTSMAGSSRYRTTDGTGSSASFSTPSDVAVDATGNVYVADGLNKIRKITPAGVVTTLAEIGINGVAVDAAGNVYVTDSYNNKIIKITDAGIVTTLAGSGSRGATDGIGTAASFNYPSGVAIDAAGNIYVADERNYRIRKITPEGLVSTLAGSGSSGVTDGIGMAASFQDPSGIAVDATGNIYVADSSNQKIRKITPAGVVTTLAGSGTAGAIDGTGTAASFNNPTGVDVDAAGNVYVADSYDHKIRKITPAGVVTTLAGIGTAGSTDGPITFASFNNPTGVAVDAAGNVYVADRFNNKIRKINNNGFRINPTLPAGLSFDEISGVISGTPTVASPMTTYTITAFNGDGKSITTISLAAVNFSPPKISYASPQSYPVGKAITPLAPTNTGGAVASGTTVSLLAGKTPGQDGTGADANFKTPQGVAVDAAGNLYVADGGNHKIRKITPEGVVTTLAGSGAPGNADGMGTSASFSGPVAVAVDAVGNCYVADGYKIRKITPAGMVSTLAGSDTSGSSDGIGSAASFSTLRGIAVDATGQIFVPDLSNHKIRKITPTGVVSTFAGSGVKGATDATGTAASFNYPNGVAVDATGNLYVAEFVNHKIRKITAAGVVTTLAGNGTAGSADGTGSAASFYNPWGISVDAMGYCYVAEFGNRKIRKISPTGAVTTLAGSGGSSYESTDGTGTNANFYQPTGIAVDANGNVYVAEDFNNKIRKISPSGVVTTLAGSEINGSSDATGTAASFYMPSGPATDASGNVYVAEFGNNKIRKITASGVVTTVAGSGSIGAVDGTGIAASFNHPRGVALDAAGNVYVADTSNNKIRKITPQGVVTTLAGSGTAGATDGTSTVASFNNPRGVALDAAGNVYVADTFNNKIRKISPAGEVSTWTGNGSPGTTDGIGTAASFNYPSGVALDAAGNVYVADTFNNTIRKITPEGVVTTLAGSGTAGATDDIGTAASFNNPIGVAVDAAGNVYVADNYNNKIRKISPSGVVTTLAGTGALGAIDGTSTAASFYNPWGLTTDAAGNVYVADTYNSKIRKININGFRINPTLPAGLSFDENTGVISGTPTVASPLTTYTVTASNSDGNSITSISFAIVNLLPPNISYVSPQSYTVGTAITPLIPENTGGLVPAGIYGKVTTLAGSGRIRSTDGIGTAASFSSPSGVAVDVTGNVYVADWYSHTIRKITPAGVVASLAGGLPPGALDGYYEIATFKNPSDVAVDAVGNVYVADSGNHKIRKISPLDVVTTLAGTGTAGVTEGTGTSASFNYPKKVAVDAAGNVYVADTYNNKIRKITPAGLVTTLAGSGTVGATDGIGTAASFNDPNGIAIDATGNVYVADSGNHKIRKISPAGEVSTWTGNGSPGATDGIGTVASFNNPSGIAVDAIGNVYVADSGNHKIRKITFDGIVSSLAGSGISGGVLDQGTDGVGNMATFRYPSDVALDSSCNVYVSEGNNKIRKINISGYMISPSLPDGLSFDATTGIISGTPTVASPMTTYTITAYNNDGSATTTIEMGTAVLGTESFTKESLTLFPNPAQNLIYLQSADHLTIDKVIITDLTGKVIIEQFLDSNSINVAQLASGMYIIKAISGQEEFTSKFMKSL